MCDWWKNGRVVSETGGLKIVGMHESLGGRHGAAGARTARADWPSRVSRVIYFLLTLGAGVMLGIFLTLHLLSYLRMGILSPSAMGVAPLRHERGVLDSEQSITYVNHGMRDEELLWRASMAPHRPGLPIVRTPKVAFMFLTVGPLPLAPLWERYFQGHKDKFSIYVHSLPDFQFNVDPTSVFSGRHVCSQVGLTAHTLGFIFSSFFGHAPFGVQNNSTPPLLHSPGFPRLHKSWSIVLGDMPALAYSEFGSSASLQV